MNIPIYEAMFNEGDEIQLISLVDRPAIEREFVAFSEEEKIVNYFNEEQQIIVSPVMIPDKLILRYNDKVGNFYTMFSKDTIEKIRYQYAKDNNFNKTNLNHKDNIDGIIMLESWIKESNDDKSNSYGFNDLPIGTWFATYKVDNKEVWSKIKEGKINGLSIEGYISYNTEKFEKQEVSITNKLLTIFSKKKKKKNNYENTLIEYFSNCGITEQQFQEEFAQADLIPHGEGDISPKEGKQGRTFYKYVGPTAERDFCKQLLDLKKLYTFDEIKRARNLSVNAGFGPEGSSTYDIWFYKGGPNCKHYWQKIFATFKSQQSKGPAVGKAGTPMYNQPNRGFLKASAYTFEDINIFGYEGKYFELAPEAIEVFNSFNSMDISDDDEGMIRSAALQLDAILSIENEAIEYESISINSLKEAIILADDFKDLMNQISQSLNIVLDSSFIDRHIDIISSYLGQEEEFIVEPLEGEIHSEFIGRCISIESKNGYSIEQSSAICHTKWDESIKLAEVGPRGGINPSKKAPNSDTPNKNPKGEGTAKGNAGTSRGAEVPKAVEETLQKKADDFNERYKDNLGYGVTIGQLKSVYQRGVGAYNTSSSPKVTSQQQWAYARVNAYLYLVKNGRPENKKYTTDYDLLPSKHPKSNER